VTQGGPTVGLSSSSAKHDRFEDWFTAVYKGNNPLSVAVEDRLKYIDHTVRLFNDVKLLNRHPLANVDNMLSTMSFEISLILRDEDVPLDRRLALVGACCTLFTSWFADLREYTHSCAFFWDSVCHHYKRHKFLSESEIHIKDAIFECLTRIITVENKYCQLGALHGLNHLRDVRAIPVIDDLISRSEESDIVAYAKIAKTFEAL
jgi:hypothetical protein